MATNQRGGVSRAYWNSAVNHASPVWAEMTRVKDLNLPMTKGEAEHSNRASSFKKFFGALLEWGLSFDYHERIDADDTVWNALWDSYLNNTAMQMAVMEGNIATSGTQGFRAFYEVFEMELVEELENVRVWNVTAKLTEFVEGGSVIEPDRYAVP